MVVRLTWCMIRLAAIGGAVMGEAEAPEPGGLPEPAPDDACALGGAEACVLSLRQLRGERRTAAAGPSGRQRRDGAGPELLRQSEVDGADPEMLQRLERRGGGSQAKSQRSLADAKDDDLCLAGDLPCVEDWNCCSNDCTDDWTCASDGDPDELSDIEKFVYGFAQGLILANAKVKRCIKHVGFQSTTHELENAIGDFEHFSVSGMLDGFKQMFPLLKEVYGVLKSCRHLDKAVAGDLEILTRYGSFVALIGAPELDGPNLIAQITELAGKDAFESPYLADYAFHVWKYYEESEYHEMGRSFGRLIHTLLA